MSLRPVGRLPASVYWRRRMLVLLPLLVLVGLVAYACAPAGNGNSTAAAPAPTRPASSTPAQTNAASTNPALTGPASTAAATTPGPATASPTTATPTTGTATAPAVGTCPTAALQVTAATSAATFAAGSQPTLIAQVANVGATSCTQDLGDPQVELTVFQGQARVWGSHDCAVQPGSTPTPLDPGRAVAVSLVWQGTTSTPGCAAPRTAVTAGTYTLQASVAGVAGTPATFAIG